MSHAVKNLNVGPEASFCPAVTDQYIPSDQLSCIDTLNSGSNVCSRSTPHRIGNGLDFRNVIIFLQWMFVCVCVCVCVCVYVYVTQSWPVCKTSHKFPEQVTHDIIARSFTT